MKDLLRKYFARQKISLINEDKVLKYIEILKEENKKYNLTRITSDEDVVNKHILDSALLSKYINCCSLGDIGSGGGFPGIILALLREDIKVTLIESIAKKANFLNMVKNELEINNLEVIRDRAENVNLQFDYVTARAVGSLKKVLPYASNILEKGSIFLAQKGPKYLEELEEANKYEMNFKLLNVDEYVSSVTRYILVFEKI